MKEGRLTEKLLAGKQNFRRQSKEDPGKVIDSVLRHLHRILNTRQGNVPIAQDYGMPDFTGLPDYTRAIRELELSIRHTIMRYEPRLKDVFVRFLSPEEDYLSLSFQIFAKLVTRDEKMPILLESYMDSCGKIQIRR